MADETPAFKRDEPQPAFKRDEPAKKPEAESKGGSIAAALWRGITQGMNETAQGGALLTSRILPEGLRGRQLQPGYIEQKKQEGSQAYAADPARQAHPGWAGLGRVAGGMIPTAPLMGGGAGMGLAGRIGLGAAQGGAQSLVQSGGDPKQAALGGAVGGAVGGAGGVIGPRISPAFQAIAQKFPNLMRMVNGADGRTNEAFQRAFANQVLEPLGVALPRGIKAGDKLVNATEDMLEDHYNQVLPHLSFDGRDPVFLASARQLITTAQQELAPSQATQFSNFIRQYVGKPLQQSGTLSGQEFKKAERDIGFRARQYSGPKADPDQQMLGEKLRDLQELMRQTLVTQNPAHGTQLQRVNNAWRRFVKMDLAANRNVDARRSFTPHDIKMVLGEGGAGSRRMMTKDDMMMREFAESGEDMLGGKSPNLGRIGKLALDIGGLSAGLAAGGAIGHPYIGASAGRVGAEAIAPGIGRALAVRHTPLARGIGSAVSRGAPVAAGATQRQRDERMRESYNANRRGDLDEMKRLARKQRKDQAQP